MIATFLQTELAKELEEVFKDFRLKNPKGEMSKINIFEQGLPIPEQKRPEDYNPEDLEEGKIETETAEDPYPYIIVRIENGNITEIGREQDVLLNLIIGTIDRELNNQGHKDVLNVIQKIIYRFTVNPILAHEYECVMPISWALQDEESYPYYIGGLALHFATTPIRREDKYA